MLHSMQEFSSFKKRITQLEILPLAIFVNKRKCTENLFTALRLIYGIYTHQVIRKKLVKHENERRNSKRTSRNCCSLLVQRILFAHFACACK